MPDEKEKQVPEEEGKEATSEEKKPAGPLLNMKTILIGVGAFVVFTVIFSVVMGVFSPAPPPQAVADSTAVKQEAVTAKQEEGDKKASAWNESYDDGAIHSDSTNGGLSPEDSVKQIAWYKQQRQEIEAEWVRIRTESDKLKQLKMETQALVDERKQIEGTNISNLAKLFETMKAEEVAAILENIPDLKVGMILQQMKKQSASQVMARLPSERAGRITMQLIDLDGEN